MAAEVPVSDVLCEAMEYLSKLGSNLRTRSENLKEKRISKEKLRNSHAVQKAASKVLLICELSKKSLDNVETGVRKVLSMLKASQAPISGKNSHKKNQGSTHRYHYFEYQSRKLCIAKKIPFKHYMSVKVHAKEMPASIQDKYPVYYDCKLKRQRCRVSTKYKTIPEKNTLSNKDQCREESICSDVRELSDDDDDNLIEKNSEALGDLCQEKVSNHEQSSSEPIVESQDSQCDREKRDHTINQIEDEARNETKEKSDSDLSLNQKNLMTSEEILDCHLDQNCCKNDVSNKSRHLKKKIHSKSDKESNTNNKSNKIRFANVYSLDSNEEPKKSELKADVNKDTIFSPDVQNNNDHDDTCVSDNSNKEPKAKKLKLTISDNSTGQLYSDSGEKISKTDKEISNQDLSNKDTDNESTTSKHCERSQPSSDGDSKPLIRCVNLSKLLKPGTLSDNSKLNNVKQSEVKKVSASKNDRHFIEKDRHQKKHELSEKENKFWAQKRKEVKEFKAKSFTVNIVRLPNLSLNFLLANNLKKITRQGNIVCEVQNEIDTPNSKQMKAVKNALLNDSESDECLEMPDAMQVKRSLLKDSDSEQNASDKENSKELDKHDETNAQEVTKDAEFVKDGLSDNLKKNLADSLLAEADREINCEREISESTVADNMHFEVCCTNEKQPDNCDQTPGENTVKDVEAEGKNQNGVDRNTQSSENETETPNMLNQTVKSSLLNDSSDGECAGFSNNEQFNISKPNESNENREVDLNNSGNEESNIQSNEKTHSTSAGINETVKSALLNSSSDDPSAGFSNQDIETPTKTNEKIKSALLNDSSDENQHKDEEEESPTKVNQKVKSSLLNDSSDIKSDESDDQRERQKTPKSKRNYARRCREVKKKIKYSSSSDSDQDKPRRAFHRKKSYISSSSSSDDVKKKVKKKKTLTMDSDSNDTNKNKSIDQVDGAVDEKSNSSVDKMVRSKAKPSGSSSQNSDNQDASDKDIDGLTNLNSLNKSRRRDTSARSREDNTSRSRSKPTPIIGEDLLKAESSSEASDVGDNEIVQELPAVALTGLNGDHMAKDDLLGETDSSVSHNDKEQSEGENADNTDEEENVKSKRRKAHAISSDSEGFNPRKMKLDDKMSDFEDSEDESSEAGKKIKRKKKASDSDASGDSNEGQKKRRRIKIVNDSDGSGSDTENEGRNKHGRKNIRKVMGKNQLEEATKKAAREEKERIVRIMERQKLYNNLDFDESGKPDEVVLEKVVLDFDPETKEPLIQVDRGLVKKLKPHQANGIKFMWDACFESVKRIKKDKGSGCILAHCMGLGKTLQVISLTHTLLIHGKLTGVNRVLVVCPLSTVLNWVNEFRMWLKHAETEFEVDVYELSRYKQNSERAFQLQQWFEGGGVCVLGYEMFRNLSADNNKKFKKKMLKSFQESLVEPGPDLVVCDEGHLLKNEKTSLSQSMNKVKTLRRIVLTGTPLQNNLKEYYCMVQFVKPNLLGKYNEYLNRFVNPITNGQYTDSTEHDIRVMKRRSHVLHKMLDGAVQRRDYGVLAPFLPPKHEYVLFITLTEVQVKLYQYYLENYSRRPLPGKSSGFLFPDFQSLQRIWTHPLVLKYNSERYEIMQQKKREREEEEDSEGSLVDFIDDDSTPDESSTEESSDDLSDLSDDSRKKSKKKKTSKKGKGKDSKASTRRGTRANPEIEDEDNSADDVVEVKYENPTEWWIKLVDEAELEDMRNSHKLILLFNILRQCETIGDKLLVFSQSLYSLDLIEHFLGKVDEATQEGRIDEKLGGHVGSWSPGVDYFRLDGSTSCENRSIWCKNFNREDNPRARLFLISTRAGGLGINLVAANRVVIFDVSWNPSHDVQSIFRVYRFGQKKPCYVYRFLAMGTMEEKIYERQVTKQAISKRVIDEQQIDRHYAENDLAELYRFEAQPAEPRPLPTLPKDRLFAEMLKEHEAQIYKYHEHDSLLENKEEETLSEEERKAAWEDFENEKNKPPPAPFPSAWPMHNGMVPSLLAQQQQQLAYAALAAMLRKDMPNINDNQIRDMLPLIYNSNPGMFGGYDYGLMQKMGEMYKYAQPGMMNPGMMNPVMNAGSGAAAVGGASGLQYEPPWQRQHQQQQQMRLQQLMQQQNQMGAKFYAGGLGSRDPIAMALQQQRAREMLMGGAGGGGGGGGASAGGAGRPRGRPPLQPRHPTTTSQDVVNLDSD